MYAVNINGEASKVCGKKKSETEWSKTMEKCALMKRFCYYCQIKVYIYDIMYVDPEIIQKED